MGWFKKKQKKEEKKEIPSLPELPKLPELPQKRIKELEPIHQLPSFPTDSLGEKFSQNTIKEAITGKKEDTSAFEKRGLEKTKEEKFQRHLREIQEPPKNIPEEFEEAAKKVKEAEPIFIRIDKFEESLQIFEKIKNQISEIEKMLKDIKQIREKEKEELELWENEIKSAKEQIEKIDKEIFSRIE